MKKKYLMIAGLLAACMVASGCGKKEQTAETQETQETQVTVAPADDTAQNVTTTPAAFADSNLVDIQTTITPTEAPETNVIGTKTSTASKVQIVNKTGLTIAQMYIRPNVDDGSEWGDALFDESMDLANNDTATYYGEKTAVNEDGETVSTFDIYIICSDEDESEFYFRKLPLGEISSITLLMEGEDEDAIPYATYQLEGSSTTVSTLKEVKERLGLSDSDDDDEEENTTSSTNSNNSGNSDSSSSSSSSSSDSDEQTDLYSDEANDAKTYIGYSKDELFDGMGDPSDSSVEDQEDGMTGYYYYDGYTVTTSFDDEGNEVVTGVW